ncbi:MAG: right-handed parallel beta-helix repeat-containing protein, partial [Myxococcales bacterium]|nr:right-handed parallel beta-helix repeat-containing protein [Myxococcales bacterium]
MLRLAAAALFLISSASLAQSYQGQLPAGTTTWAGSVTMTGDVTVPAGATLVVQPGTTVTAATTDAIGGGSNATKVELIVNGTLTVSGVSGGGVVFTGAGTGASAWGGIRVMTGGAATISWATIDELMLGLEVNVPSTLGLSNSTLSGSTQCLRSVSGTGTGTYTVTNTTFSGCIQGGVTAHAGGDLSLTGSAVTGTSSSYSAVTQSGGTLSLSQTRVTNNGSTGVAVTGGTTTTIDRSTVSLNGGYGLYTSAG